MKYNPAGWHLPYEHYVLSDPKKLLVTYSLQTLLVLLTHDLRPDNATPTQAPAKNMYRLYFGKLHRKDDFQFLVDGINRLLSLPIQSNASVLPGSQRTTKSHAEAMVLFWEVWKCNKVQTPRSPPTVPQCLWRLADCSDSGRLLLRRVDRWIF
jgi:hypothetical protein